MTNRNISIVVFYTKSGKILLQERKGFSKFGEEWTIFGGKIEQGETPKEALIREIDEELDYELKCPKHIGSCSTLTKNIKTGDDVNMAAEVYTKEIIEDLSLFRLKEGSNMSFFTIKEAKKLKLCPLDNKCVKMFKFSLANKL